MSTPDTINIYRLFDPLDIQLLQLDMEQAAVDTGDFMPGYAKLQIFDNGFWTLTNELPPLNSTAPEAGGIEEAKTAAELWMKNFDTLLAGGDKERSPSAEEAYQTMLATTHPRYHPTTAPKTKKPQAKPKFFENVRYVNAFSEKQNEDSEIIYKIIYRPFIKISNEEEEIGVIGFLCSIELYCDLNVKTVFCNFLPVRSAEAERRLRIQENESELSYKYIKELNMVLPFYN